MIRDLLFVDKPVKISCMCAISFQWIYIFINLFLIVFFDGSVVSKTMKVFTIITFLILNFTVNFSLYNNARSKEELKFMSGLVEIYDKILKSI